MEKVYVFGRGTYYQFKAGTVKDRYELYAFVDNHAGNSGEGGIPSYTPAELSGLPPYKILVMTASSTCMEMMNQLLQLHISPERIIMGLGLPPAFNECETLLEKIRATLRVTADGCCVQYAGGQVCLTNTQQLLEFSRRTYKSYDPYIAWLAQMPVEPLSRHFGHGRGTPIDRYYIEAALQAHRACICGDVYEVAEQTYTRQYGAKGCHSHVIHVAGARGALRVNLATGEGVQADMADCFICTQTIQMIYDVQTAVKNIYRILKPGGTAIVTAQGMGPISLPDYQAWGEYWHFTAKALRRWRYASCTVSVWRICIGRI